MPKTRAIFREDLRAYLSDRELAWRVEQAVCRIRFDNDANKPALNHFLLGILTFSYATGCYATDEIEQSLNNNPAEVEAHDLLFKNASPAAVLRGFRRSNRRQIEECLMSVLQSICFDQCFLARDFQEEAINRVNRAIQADSWALEV